MFVEAARKTAAISISETVTDTVRLWLIMGRDLDNAQTNPHGRKTKNKRALAMPKTGKDIFDAEQHRIDVDALAHRILAFMVQHQRRGESGVFTDGLVWSASMIAEHAGISERVEQVEEALQYLLKNMLVERRLGQWYITRIAEEILEAEMHYTSIRTGASTFEFRLEALTGMDRFGNRTELESAALPSNAGADCSTNRTENDMVNHCARVERDERDAKKLGMTVDEMRDGIDNGSVKRCKGIDGVVRSHWGKFYRGQSLCIECRKRLRKAERWKR